MARHCSFVCARSASSAHWCDSGRAACCRCCCARCCLSLFLTLARRARGAVPLTSGEIPRPSPAAASLTLTWRTLLLVCCPHPWRWRPRWPRVQAATDSPPDTP